MVSRRTTLDARCVSVCVRPDAYHSFSIVADRPRRRRQAREPAVRGPCVREHRRRTRGYGRPHEALTVKEEGVMLPASHRKIGSLVEIAVVVESARRAVDGIAARDPPAKQIVLDPRAANHRRRSHIRKVAIRRLLRVRVLREVISTITEGPRHGFEAANAETLARQVACRAPVTHGTAAARHDYMVACTSAAIASSAAIKSVAGAAGAQPCALLHEPQGVAPQHACPRTQIADLLNLALCCGLSCVS